ncbi:MAG: HNH endonuclease signature motif containing protein [Candidatus Kryptoniota bacterium]
MSRMNGRDRKKWYAFLAKRDGEHCRKCGKAGTSKTLIIDHIDNDNSNNVPENFQLLCRSCNAKKNHRGKAKLKNQSIEIYEAPTSKQIILNEKYKPKFCEYAERRVRQYGWVEMKDLISSGAQITGASTQTIERYLDPMCSTEGQFFVAVVDGVKYVEFKP